jgi:uncharacterized protein
VELMMASELKTDNKGLPEHQSCHPAGRGAATPSPQRRGYYIYITEACNLRCSYCFVKDKHNHRHLTTQMADSVLSFIRAEAAQLKEVNVHFFGGEPLLRPRMVDYLAGELRKWSAADGVSLRLGITTNGTLLTTQNCEMLKQHGVGVQLSLDGSKNGNDVHRQLMGGTQCGLPPSGAFDLVQIDNYKKYFGRTTPNCRMTVTVHNLQYLSQSIRELHNLGFSSFSIIPDADCGAWTPEYLRHYEGEMAAVFAYWVQHRDISVNAISKTLDALIRRTKRAHLCPAGATLVGITVDGDIYPCHDFAGRYAADAAERNKLLLGNVQTGYSSDPGRLREPIAVTDATSGSGYDCATCPAKWVCGRGCPYMNYAHSGDIRTVNATYCETMRINTALALRWMSVLGEFRFVDVTKERPATRNGPPWAGTSERTLGRPVRLQPDRLRKALINTSVLLKENAYGR